MSIKQYDIFSEERKGVNPEITNIVSFSGGRTSAYLCSLVKKADKDALFVFMDTGAEHPKTYEFVKKVNRWLDLNLICIQAVISPVLGEGVRHRVVDIDSLKTDLKVFRDYVIKNGNPVAVGATCSDRMKAQTFKDWKRNNIDSECITWLGMRADEPRRLKQKDGIRYLAEISDFDKQDVLDFWDDQDFDLEIDEHLGNCVFCVKKSAGKIALAARDEPILYQQFKDLIYSDDVRVMPNRKSPSNAMYRDYMSLDGIVESFADKSRQEIADNLRFTKKYDTGSCSESCEADL